ncbi:hypothetical protein [Streptomyces hydrogenans]
MRIRPITAAAGLLLALTLTACSSSEEPATDKPTASATTAAPTTTAPVDLTAATEACIEAVRQSLKTTPTGEDLERPTECEPLDDSAYLEAYMKGLQQRNQDGRDELQRQIDEAASADAATP